MIKLRYKYYLALSDFAILILSVFLSVYLVDQNGYLSFLGANFQSGSLIIPIVLISSIYALSFESSNLYKSNIILTKSAHLTAVIKAIFYTVAGLLIVSLILFSSSLLQAGLLIVTFALTSFLFLYLFRVEIITPLYTSRDDFRKNILIVGDGKNGKLITEKFSSSNNGVYVAGFVSNSLGNNSEVISSKKVLGALDEIDSIINKNNIHEIIVAYDGNDYDELFSVVDRCIKENINLKISSPLFKVIEKKLGAERYWDVPVINLSAGNTLYQQLKIKRLIDILGSLFGLIILAPVFLLISIIIKTSSPGPVFFKQMRIGKDGKLFRFYKFRSMHNIKGEDEERVKLMKEFVKKERIENGDAKVVDNSRVTKIGKILRRTSVDELPQLWNVLKGEMSLVGPRPDVPYVYDLYDKWQKRRVQILPGCTGVWQVTGRSAVTFNETMILDIYYIHNISFLLDLEMILKTFPVMLFSRGGN